MILCCDQTDSNSTLLRLYQNPSGEWVEESLIDLEDLLLTDRPTITHIIADREEVFEVGRMTQFVSGLRGGELYVALCSQPKCNYPYTRTYGQRDASARQTVFRSTDGGVTWSDFGQIGGDDKIVGSFGSDHVLVATPSNEWFTLPGFNSVYPPEDSGSDYAIIAGDGKMVWASTLEIELAPQLNLNHAEYPNALGLRQSVALPSTGETVVEWLWTDPDSGRTLTLLEVLDDAQHAVGIFAWRYSHRLAAPVSDTILLMRSAYHSRELPDEFGAIGPQHVWSMLDLADGVLYPIRGDLLPAARTLAPVAVQTGPFARVVNTRSCLNLRSSPGLDAPKVACLADGVLLRHASVAVTNQDVEWLQVTAPDGTEGWAATEFLEY